VKNLIALLVLVLCLTSIWTPKASATVRGLVPLSVKISQLGISKGQVGRFSHWCKVSVASRKYAVQKGQIIKFDYFQAVFYLDEQMELAENGFGELYVSRDTRCFPGYISADTNLSWRFIGLANPFPRLHSLYAWTLSAKGSEAQVNKSYCRSNSLGFAYDWKFFPDSTSWKEKNLKKVVFEITSEGDIKGSTYPIWGTYTSRYIACF
jgi:hypothetical protein